jgi:predicted phosphodiesterase
VVLTHGSPVSLTEYLHAEKPDSIFAQHLEAAGADVLICGHTHKPFHKVLGDRHVINADSAGKPKNGNPNATYVLIDITAGGVVSEIVEVPYDYEAAARAIEATDLPHEFAQLLRDGRG